MKWGRYINRFDGKRMRAALTVRKNTMSERLGPERKNVKRTKNDSIDWVKDESLPSAIDNLKVQCNSWPRHWLNIANTLVERNRLLQFTARGIQ